LIPCASQTSGRSKRVAGSIAEQSRIPWQDAAGEIVRLRAIGPFTLSEHLYPAGMVLPKHAHRHVYFTFVLEGSFQEKSAGQTLLCRPGTVRFLPAGEIHEDVIETRLRCLHIKAEASVLEELDRHSVVPRRPTEISGLTATWLANRLYAEFSREDSASSIAVEGLILEILAEIARVETKPRPALVPNWLKHATDIVESRFLERLSLAEIASEVGVHYVHLSRQFHKYNRCTIGDLIRRRRVQHASHLLAHSRTPLAEIALICGFSDQSHLSFLFKRYMGLSPSKFRHMAEQESTPRAARLRAMPYSAGMTGK
jgi:AraC family transcriptional regulator